MPWVEVEEGGDEVEAEGCGEGEDDDAGAAGGEKGLDFALAGFGVEGSGGEGVDDEIDGVDDDVELNYGEDAEGGDVGPA